ncbi:MAG: nucleotidyltransferase domain-containing protein [Bacteroidota bacterium]
MKTLNQIHLTPSQLKALDELKQRLANSFGIVEITLFGSVPRGEADNESDLDVLLVTLSPLHRSTRHQITDIVCEINLQFDTNLSTLVVDEASWQSGLFSILPIHAEILNDGVRL